MPILLPVAAIVVLMAMSPPPAAAASCPGNANRASLDVWPPNSIPTGTRVTAQHPCGRTITCSGGIPNQLQTRTCRWK